MISRRTALGLLASVALPRGAVAETALFDAEIAAGTLPAMADRLPKNPRVIDLASMGRETGRYGGTVRMIVGGQRDVRLIPIYSYSRLMGYDDKLQLQPDVLAACDVVDNRIYTLRLREGHRWSDGAPYTSEDWAPAFRFGAGDRADLTSFDLGDGHLVLAHKSADARELRA